MGAIPETMMSNSGTTPWHGIGTIIDEFVDGQRALELGGIDWSVRRVPLYTYAMTESYNGSNDMDRVESHVALQDSNGRNLSVVSPKYEVLQNEELADITDTLGLNVQTCGQMWDGKFVWMLSDLGESPRFDGTDEAMHRWLLVSTWHGSGAFRIEGVNIRVVCENTLRIAQSGGELFHSIQHRSGAYDRLAEAKLALVETYNGFDEFDAWAASLMNKPVSRVTFGDEVLEQLFPRPDADASDRVRHNWHNRRQTLRNIFDGPTIGGQETAWHFLQTINEYELWHQGHGKDTTRRAKQTAQAKAWANARFPLTNKAAGILQSV